MLPLFVRCALFLRLAIPLFVIPEYMHPNQTLTIDRVIFGDIQVLMRRSKQTRPEIASFYGNIISHGTHHDTFALWLMTAQQGFDKSGAACLG
ncbi:MAG: hypothetical protein KJZ73_00930 [Pseudorhodoplanes sp.]|nr:hypothetical protein [Pseudorhodoplanes sp.]